MSDLRKAAEMALRQLNRDDEYLGHRSKTRADAINALRQALAQSEQKYATKVLADGTFVTEPLYTAPPKREWVGLTDDEIYDYADKFLYQHGSNFGIKSFGKAIEAKLKEKNA